MRRIAFALMGILAAYPCYATVIHVPADYPSIQAGINASVNGDTVLVAPATYEENINFAGKRVTVRSAAGPAETFLTKAYAGIPIARFVNSEDSSAIIEGFDFFEGDAPNGSAIFCNGSSPTISSNIFENNATQTGCVEIANGTKAIIRNNIFRQNDGSTGYVMYLAGSEIRMEYNVFRDNTNRCIVSSINCNAELYGNEFTGNSIINTGFVLYFRGQRAVVESNFFNLNNVSGLLAYVDSPTEYVSFQNNEFRGNIAAGDLLQIWVPDTVDFTGNLIEQNDIDGGICARIGANLVNFNRNIFFNNVSQTAIDIWLPSYGVYGECKNNSVIANECGVNPVMEVTAGVDMPIENSIFSDNDGLALEGGQHVMLQYSLFWNNSRGDTYGIIPGVGMISSNPLLVDGWHLTGSSPCIDAGNPGSPYDPDSTITDMGALYFDQRYRILNFHLVGPAGDSVYLDSPEQFVWHSTTDIDSGYQCYYKFFMDDNQQFSSPDSSGELSDTTFALQDSLSRSAWYYWRVLAYNYHAVPTYSNETWGFYVDGFPTAPVILGPENGHEADSSTYLSWLLGSDPDPMDTVKYTLQVDNDPAFNSPEIDISGITESGLATDEAVAVMLGDLPGFSNLQWGESYFWRVRSDDKLGLSSTFTDGSNYFALGFDANDPPYPPVSGFSPANGEEVISLTPVITWNDADDPDDNGDNLSYAIRLSEDSLFAGFVYYDTTAPGINQIAPSSELDDNSHYFYQVMTIDDGGLSSDWSARQDFWTNHYNFPPEPFPLYGPESGARQVVFYTHFGWGGTVDYDPNASFTYSFQWAADSSFTGFVGSVHGLTDTTLTIPTDSLALLGQNIFWRILAVDDDSLMRIGGIPEENRLLNILPPGDANSNGTTNGVDVTFLVNYLKGIGPAPDPLLAGDANGNCQTNGVDVTYLVNYLKGFGAAPIRPICLPGM